MSRPACLPLRAVPGGSGRGIAPCQARISGAGDGRRMPPAGLGPGWHKSSPRVPSSSRACHVIVGRVEAATAVRAHKRLAPVVHSAHRRLFQYILASLSAVRDGLRGYIMGYIETPFRRRFMPRFRLATLRRRLLTSRQHRAASAGEGASAPGRAGRPGSRPSRARHGASCLDAGSLSLLRRNFCCCLPLPLLLLFDCSHSAKDLMADRYFCFPV